MSKTLILVAEGSRARLYLSNSPTKPWQEIEDLIEPKGRMHEGDLVTDEKGADPGTPGGEGKARHVFEDKVAPTEAVQQAFANELCGDLERRRLAGEYNRLILVAAPAFLGMLRKCMSPEVTKMVVEELAKDLVMEDAQSIRDRLATLC